MSPFATVLIALTPLPDASLATMAAPPPVFQSVLPGADDVRFDLRGNDPLVLSAVRTDAADNGRYSTVQASTSLSFSLTLNR